MDELEQKKRAWEDLKAKGAWTATSARIAAIEIEIKDLDEKGCHEFMGAPIAKALCEVARQLALIRAKMPED